MAKPENNVSKFEKAVDEIIDRRLVKISEQVRAIDGTWTEMEMVELLLEANRFIHYACGRDEDLYEKSRYRLFYNSWSNKYVVLQGEEVDTDFTDDLLDDFSDKNGS